MKKLILSFSLIISFAFYAFWSSSRNQAIAQISSQTNKELNISPIIGANTNVVTNNGANSGISAGTNTIGSKTSTTKATSSGTIAPSGVKTSALTKPRTTTIVVPGSNGTAGVTIKYATNGSTNGSVAYVPTPVSTPSSMSSMTTPTPIQSQTTNSAQTGTSMQMHSGKFKDGSYTGPAIDVYYGNVQVSATISGGRLTDVQFLQYPSDRGTSKQKSMMSMPILTSEAITAQSATVDAVSGATETSTGFVSSLGAALALAAN